MRTKTLTVLLALLTVVGLSTLAHGAGGCSLFHDYTVDPRVTASNLTSSFRTVGQTNMVWQCLDDYSADQTQMGAVTDPYPVGTPSLATTAAGELERLRFVIKKITGWSQWYAHTEVSQIGGSYFVRGFSGRNNSSTPTTTFDLSAELVGLRSPSNGTVVVRGPTGTLTNDTLLKGPIANGRDHGDAHPANSWIHFYFIWNAAEIATISSQAAPPGGPILPTGYTHWAYAGAVRYNATSILQPTILSGATARLVGPTTQRVLTAGAATTGTPVSTAEFVPPNALRLEVMVTFRNTVTAGAFCRVYERLNEDGGGLTTHAAVINQFFVTTGQLANVAQQVHYINSGADGEVFIDVLGYTMPNGGE